MSPAIKPLLIPLLCGTLYYASVAQRKVTPMPENIRAAIVSMLPEGEITATVLDSDTNHRQSIKTADFSIASDGEFFWFWADGMLAVDLESVRIDLERNVVQLGDRQLAYAGTANGSRGGTLQSDWHGHTWYAEGYGRFTLGQLKTTGQTFLQLQTENTVEEKDKLRFDLSLLF